MKRVLAIHFNTGEEANACQIYRANTPLHYLNQQPGWDGHWTNWRVIAEDYYRRGRIAFIELVERYDLFVFPRVTAAFREQLTGLSALIELIRLFKKRCVYEVDDDFTNEHRDLRSMGVEQAMLIASWTDAITVTTPYLAKLMEKRTGRPAYVLPNCLDPNYWHHPERRKPHEGLVIGLSGSLTHKVDWQVLMTVMPAILGNDYGFPVTFRVTGYHPEYLRGLPNTEYIAPLPYPQYVEMVRSCDIILAPVDPEDKFNLSKSPIKVIEGMGASREEGGAACIATDNLVYRSVIEHGKNGLLCSQTHESWYNAIDSLLRNEPLRLQLQRAGHRFAWKRHDMSQQWRLWASAYQKILNKPANQKHTLINQ